MTYESHPPAWQLEYNGGPIVGMALHASHAVRPELRPLLAISHVERKVTERLGAFCERASA